MCSKSVLTMVASLAFLSLVRALSIDNQLTVIKQDCFERLAIGHRLDSKNIYQTLNYNTVSDCQKACTNDKEDCKAFSFGIGVKGNGSCELSHEFVKETDDLKPIGTILDTDFDVYIKKLGCQIVVEDPTVHASSKPLNNDINPNHGSHVVVPPSEHDSTTISVLNQSVTVHSVEGTLDSSSNHQAGGYLYLPPSTPIQLPQQEDDIHHVQTVVSIAEGPNTYLHPVHEILLGQDIYAQQNNEGYRGTQKDNIPPFRPISLNYPYEERRPQRNQDYDRPDPVSYHRPHAVLSTAGYGEEDDTFRPNWPVQRPYYSIEGFDGIKTTYNRQDNLIPPRPPLPDRYGFGITHPDKYDKRPTNYDYLFRPEPADPHRGPYKQHSHTIEEYDHKSSYHQHYEYGENAYDYQKGYHYPQRLPWDYRPGSAYPPRGYQYPKPDYSFNNRKSENKKPSSDSSGGKDYPPLRLPWNYQPVSTYQGPTYPLVPDNRPNDNDNYGFNDRNFEDKKVTNNSSDGKTPKPQYGLETPHRGNGEKTKDTGINQNISDQGKKNPNSIVTQSIGSKGQHITSIITEIKEACFRRVLADNRVVRGLVRRTADCETAEQCQRECAEERRFVCEGFNYRLDPTGRGKGDCELLDLPFSKLDLNRDFIPDRDYDYYEKDTYATVNNCRQPPSGGYRPIGGYDGYRGSGGSYHYDRRGEGTYYDRGDRPHIYPDDRRRPIDNDIGLRRPGDKWPEDTYGYRPRRPDTDRRNDDWYQRNQNRRGDQTYRHSQHEYESSHSYRYKYDDSYSDSGYTRVYDRKPLPYRPHYNYLPPKPYHDDRERDRNYWGVNTNTWEGTYGGNYGYGEPLYRNGYHQNQYHNKNRYNIDSRNYYLPAKPQVPKDWGVYGGTYGYGSNSHTYHDLTDNHQYNYWGFNKFKDNNSGHHGGYHGGQILPPKPHYLPVQVQVPKLPDVGTYLAVPQPTATYLPLPTQEPLVNYNFKSDECSLRSATGFKIHKGTVKKFYAVPNIYECELLCFKEKDFLCGSYAFRYTVTLSVPTDNCYLSHKNYKELDYYTDIEPDRDFDIYTMNNRNKCETPVIYSKENSDCFWRVRSGQRLDHKVVRDSLTVNSAVECQLECLRSIRFTCRAYSFRYGPPVIGGAIDNCQLTNWPYYELEPREHFVSESGFEVYERGSFGHGCEPHHFNIRGKPANKHVDVEANQLCYIGFGTPARLLPSAAKKSMFVSTELECKAECSKARAKTLFQCMSFSFRTGGPKSTPNCLLSNIYQRDLLPEVDYTYDPESWLFAWDNYNPECISLVTVAPINNGRIDSQHIHLEENYGLDFSENTLDTWRVYSVSGWPCRRGSVCQQNHEAGFWFCPLEYGDKNSWDYCCRPDHQCGASNGYPYQWCYVGPGKSQWRKCNDRYYPYLPYPIERPEYDKNYLPALHNHLNDYPSSTFRPGIRPDRLPAPPLTPSPTPSLDEYEEEFNNQFLSPPKPGGFGPGRRWPVSYLHKEMPVNATNTTRAESRMMKLEINSKYDAIQNLIKAIKNNDLNKARYHIANESIIQDDVFVKIPLHSNFTDQTSERKRKNVLSSFTSAKLDTVDLAREQLQRSNQSYKAMIKRGDENSSTSRPSPVYRKGFVTRTNVTNVRG